MAKQLNVNLAFTADTSQAKKQLQDLQKSLTNLTNNSFGNKELGLTKEIESATAAAAQLKVQLQAATNPQTGKLDLGLFDEAMKKSGMSLEKYRNQLVQLGPEGQKAFLGLAQSITNAELPLRRSSQLLDQFWTALKNTARWQLSSSALHGFMGAIQGAYGYAQDLDKSLNSIRIVSGQSSEQMAELAEHANRAAQALSTSTLAYTDAALIYYQQGLDPEEVAARTETTLKMSNVTGESADAVSSYMTAIWNNFAEGSENLEYFADVITALGASTASSSEEIANGMQQFAAVAETVGLSYEYAASALATIVATTRQSESTVGNGLRTIFARFDSVKLGETLEDGVGLTKYTEALQKAGVSVLDQNGQLKEMDEILNDIGERWNQLNKTQQTALAQTVGGVRQYTNLIALFDNWGDFQKNLQTAYNSTGSLQEQADIYAESWEAARKRVQASWQAIYQDLIDDKFFITLLNGIQKALQGLDGFIDGLGGLKGVLATVGATITMLFENQLAKSLENAAYNLKMMTSSGRQEIEQLREKAWNLSVAEVADSATADEVSNTEATNYKQTALLQKTLYENAHRMSEEELKINQLLLDRNQTLQKNNVELAKAVQLAEKEYSDSRNNLLKASQKEAGNDFDLSRYQKGVKELDEWLELKEEELALYEKEGKSLEEVEELQAEYYSEINRITDAYKLNGDAVDRYIAKFEEYRQKQRELGQAQDALASNTTTLIAKFKAGGVILQSLSQDIVRTAQTIATITQVFTTISGIINTLKDDSLSPWEKFTRVVGALTTSVILLNRAFDEKNKKSITHVTTVLAEIAVGKKHTQTLGEEAAAATASAVASEADTVAKEGEAVATGVATAANESFIASLSILLPYVIAIGAAIAVLVVAFKGMDQELNYGKHQLKEANEELSKSKEALDEAATAADKAKNGYKELSDILNNFDGKKAEIHKLTEGTEEWRQAINDSNEALLSALENAGQLGKVKINYDTNGLASISKNDRQAVLNSAQNNVLVQDVRQSLAKIEYANSQKEAGIASALQDIKNVVIQYQEAEIQHNTGLATGKTLTKETSLSAHDSYNVVAGLAQQLADVGLGGISAEQLKQELNDNPKLKFLEKIPDLQNRDDLLQAIAAAADQISSSDRTSEAYKAEAGRRFAETNNLSFLGFAQDEIWKMLGNQLLNDDRIQQIVNEINSGQGNQYKQLYAENTEGVNWNGKNFTDDKGVKLEIEPESVAQLVAAIDSINNIDVKNLDYTEAYQQAKVNLAQDVVNNSSVANTKIDRQQFEDWFNSLSDEELTLLAKVDIDKEDSLKDIQEKMDDISHEISFNIDSTALNNFKGNSKKTMQEDLEAEVMDLADYIQANVEDIDGLSEHLEECRAEAEKTAYAIIRFDDAIQDISENYEDWSNILRNGAMQEQVKLGNELQKVYANLFNVDRADLLSKKFLQNADNLDLMKQAAEGAEEAYNKLADRAAVDMLSNVNNGFGYTEQEAWNLVNSINSAFDAIEAALGRPIEAGENINFQGVNDKAYAAQLQLETILNGMLETIGNDVSAANALLAQMGYDAEFEEETETLPETTQVTDVVPEAFDGPMVDFPRIVGSDEQGVVTDSNPFQTQGIRVKLEPHEETLESTKKVTALKIKPGSLHKAVGGNIKYNQTSHGAGSQGAGKTPKSSGSKGSSPKSSTPKKKTVKEHKEQKKEEDRYHDLKERIDDVNTALKRMGKTKDRVYGKAKLKYMDQELARMKDQIALTKEYIKEAENYLKVDRAALEGIKKGAAFDENGMLTNYEEVLKNITEAYNNQLAQYNAAVDTFNASDQEDAATAAFEAEEKALAKAEKTFNENKKILKQYEDTYNLIQKQQEELIDQLNEYYDTLLENVDIKVQMKIDLEEDDKKLLEWMYKYIGDSADYAADKIANLAKQVKASKNELDIMRQGLVDIFKNHDMDVDINNLDADDLVSQLRAYMNQEGLASEMTEAEIAKIREYRDALMEYYDDMYDNMVKSNEVLREMMEEQDDRIQRQLDNYDRLADAIEHWNDIAELTGEDVLGLNTQELNRLDQSRVANDWNRMDSTKRYMEEREREYIRLQQSYAEAEAMGDELVLAEVRKNLELAEDLYHEAQDAWRDSWKKAQEDVNQAAENAMDRMVKDYKRALGDLDVLMERYDRQRENNHLYLEDYEKYHELNKSMKDLQNSMNNTNNQKILSKMRDLEDEINASMQSGVKISERQAEIIARRVALLQAEAELMDAQNAKSAVRMTRDNEGNFSYTYTADQEQIDDAEQNYGDKFYELMKYEKDEIEALEAERLQSEAQYIEGLRNLWDEYRNGDISSYEEYLALVDELTAQYEERRQYYSDQEAFLFDEQARLRDEDWRDFEEITGNKLAEQWNFVDEFEDTITGTLLPGYQSLDEAQADWAQAMTDGYETAKQNAAAWQSATHTTLDLAGTDADNFRSKMLTDLGNIDDKSIETKEKIEDMISGPDGMAEQFDAGIAKSDEFNQEFARHNEEEREQIRQTVAELNEMIRKLAETTQEEKNLETQSYITKGAVDTMAEAAESAIGAVEALTDAANSLAGAANAAAAAIDNLNSKDVRTPHPGGYEGGGGATNSGFTFDTGGYTGDFGPMGKLAILHEKEIVLNKEDTTNMLNVVGMVRDMASSFNLNERLDGLLSMATAATGIAGPQVQSLDQNVHIEASFPNVQSHNEIELALNNLINSASQFVNRK